MNICFKIAYTLHLQKSSNQERAQKETSELMIPYTKAETRRM